MKKNKDVLVGELAQMLSLLDSAIATKDKDGAIQVYSMILWHIAHKHSPTLVDSLDESIRDL